MLPSKSQWQIPKFGAPSKRALKITTVQEPKGTGEPIQPLPLQPKTDLGASSSSRKTPSNKVSFPCMRNGSVRQRKKGLLRKVDYPTDIPLGLPIPHHHHHCRRLPPSGALLKGGNRPHLLTVLTREMILTWQINEISKSISYMAT